MYFYFIVFNFKLNYFILLILTFLKSTT